jgi:DNA-binding NarL/FixJ family response regulator
MKSDLRIALIDDDQDFVESIREYIDAQPDMQCVVTAENPGAFYQQFEDDLKLDVILLDIMFGADNALQSIWKIRRLAPGAKIVLVSGHRQTQLIHQALQQEIDGYFLKGNHPDTLLEAIRVANTESAFLSPEVTRIALNDVKQHSGDSKQLRREQIKSRLQWDIPERALLVIEGLLDGLSYVEISKQIGLSIDGVRYYVRMIYKNLDIDNRQDLIRLCRPEDISGGKTAG